MVILKQQTMRREEAKKAVLCSTSLTRDIRDTQCARRQEPFR